MEVHVQDRFTDPLLSQPGNENLFLDPLSWHKGNREMHSRMSASTPPNPTSEYLTPFRAHFLNVCNLFAIGVLDGQGRPWTSLWGGEQGTIKILNLATIELNNLVDRKYDPVAARLLEVDSQEGRAVGSGILISGLGIKLETRDRVKLAGRIWGAMFDETSKDSVAKVRVLIQVDSSLGW
jgi:hypothetical protein